MIKKSGIYGLNDLMPWGRHKGVLIATLIEDETEYVDWLLNRATVATLPSPFRLDQVALNCFEAEMGS